MPSVLARVYLALLFLAVLSVGLVASAVGRELPYGEWARWALLGSIALAALPAFLFVRAHIVAHHLVRGAIMRMDPKDLPKRHAHTFLGFHFPWTGGRAERLYRLMAQGYEPPAKMLSLLGGNPAIHGLGAWDEKPLFIPNKKRTHHVLVTGSPGEGKTRFLDLMLCQLISQGDAVIILDPKGDERAINMVRQACLDAGRMDRFRLVAIPWPSASLAYNPLSHFGSPAEIADRIMGIFSPAPGDAEAYRGFQWAVVHAIAQGIYVAGLPMTIARILRYLRDLKELLREVIAKRHPTLVAGDFKTYCRKYEEAVAGGKMKRAPELDDLNTFASYLVTDSGAGYFAKMVGSLLPQLERLTADYRRELFSPETEDLKLRDILTWQGVDTGRLVVYCYLGSLHGEESAKALGKMMLLDFKSYVARRYSYATTAPAGRISLVVDEAHHMISEPFLQILAEARGADIAVLLATQTTSQFEQAMGTRAAVDEVLTQHFAHVQFQSRNPREAKDFSDLAGTRQLRIVTESESFEPGFFSSGLETIDDFRAHYARSAAPKELPLIPPWAVTQLPTFHYFARIAGQIYKGRVPLLTDPDPTFTSEIRKGAPA